MDWLSASSDFEEKLVTSWSPLGAVPVRLFGTVSEFRSCPLDGLSSSSTIGWVTPKLPSTLSLLKTSG